MKLLYKYLKISFLIITFISIFSTSKAERIFSVVFDEIPKDNQMYARDDQNQASVPISGIIETDGFSHMSMVVFKNGKRSAYSKSALDYKGGTRASFSMSSKINAELAEYTIEIYACKAADSVVITTRSKILAGDFFVISGQSNAAAALAYRTVVPDSVNKFSRTLGRTPDTYAGSTLADTLWKTPDWVTPGEGYWGRDLQRQIIEKYKIPVCIINGAIPGTNIAQHLDRNSSNPQDFGTIYGSLLYRVLKLNTTKIRAFFWYQGEEDAWNTPENYSDRFDKLMKFWQIDYPMVDKFIVFQINIMDRPHYESGALREFQRQTKNLYPKTDHFAAMGLGPLIDNIHYTEEGYTKLATQLTSYLGPKIYKTADSLNVDSPEIQKIFYSKSKDAITMVFDDNQTMKWQADTVYNNARIELKNQFFLDGDESKPAPISSWEVAGNKVTIHLSQPVAATRINYLLSYKDGYYHGPFLYNGKGLGAFSFHEVTINPALNDLSLTASVTQSNTIKLDWKKSGEDALYILEKKAEGQPAFTILKTFDQSVLTYEDTDVAINTAYTYRMKAISKVSESPFSEITIKTMSLLGTEPVSDMEWKIYPNPTRDFIAVDFKTIVSGQLILRNIIGQNIAFVDINASSTALINLTNSISGLYFMTFIKKNGDVITKRIMKL